MRSKDDSFNLKGIVFSFVLMTVLMLVPPFVMAVIMKWCSWFDSMPGGISEWIPFWGSYLGGILAFIGVYITIRVQIKYNEEQRKEEQERIKEEQKRIKEEQRMQQEQHEQQISNFIQFRKNTDKKVMISYLVDLDNLRSRMYRQHILFLEEFSNGVQKVQEKGKEMHKRNRMLEHMVEEYQFLYRLIFRLLLIGDTRIEVIYERSKSLTKHKQFIQDLNIIRDRYLDIIDGKEKYLAIIHLRDMKLLREMTQEEGKDIDRLLQVIIEN